MYDMRQDDNSTSDSVKQAKRAFSNSTQYPCFAKGYCDEDGEILDGTLVAILDELLRLLADSEIRDVEPDPEELLLSLAETFGLEVEDVEDLIEVQYKPS